MKPEDIVALLTVMDLAKQWPELSAIHDNARATLLEVNAEAKQEIADRAADAKAKVLVDAERAKPRAIPSTAAAGDNGRRA